MAITRVEVYRETPSCEWDNKCHLSNSCAWNWFTHVSSEFIEVNACSIAVCIGNQLMLFTSGDTSSLTSACDLKLAKGV